jgi:hypothetical protein
VVLARLDSPAMPISWTEHVLVSAGPSTCWSMGAGPGTARAYARLQLFGRPSASLMSCRRIRTTASHCRRNRPLRPTGRSDGLHPGRQRQGEHGQLDQGDHRHSCMPPTPRTCSPSRLRPLIGGARMGSCPERSVVDANQLRAVSDLFLAGGSVRPPRAAPTPPSRSWPWHRGWHSGWPVGRP